MHKIQLKQMAYMLMAEVTSDVDFPEDPGSENAISCERDAYILECLRRVVALLYERPEARRDVTCEDDSDYWRPLIRGARAVACEVRGRAHKMSKDATGTRKEVVVIQLEYESDTLHIAIDALVAALDLPSC